MNRHLLRSISFVTLLLLAMLLIAATFMEKYYGTAITTSHVYHSPLFIATWTVMALSAIAYIACVSRQATLIMLHASLAVILLGALVSFMTSRRGDILLSRDSVPASMFTTPEHELEKLPFRMTLSSIETFRIEEQVSNYRACIAVDAGERTDTMAVSLNNPATKGEYSFCIKGVSERHLSLLVSYDPWGMPISYAGYLMTIISFIALLYDRKSRFRSLVDRFRRRKENEAKTVGRGRYRYIAATFAVCLLTAIAIAGICRWHSTGMFPVTNGHGSLMLMAWLALLAGCVCTYRKSTGQVAGIMFSIGAAATIVALITWGEGGEGIQPILRTPLLGIHVSAVIAAYLLLGCIALNSAVAIWYGTIRKNTVKMEKMALVGRIMLYPATILLTAGIFIGAVWANISWGRYWGWDPKEVWALITLIACSFMFHTRSLPFMAKAQNFHIFALIAFLAMLFTFFGVNYLFGGLHSYM